MWSSTLPTGTVREEGRGSRTYPQSARQPARSRQSDRQPRGELAAEVDRLRQEKQQAEAEIQQLEAQIELLRSQLDHHQESKRAMVDRYERVIAELETAAATAPTRTETSNRGILDRLTELF